MITLRLSDANVEEIITAIALAAGGLSWSVEYLSEEMDFEQSVLAFWAIGCVSEGSTP